MQHQQRQNNRNEEKRNNNDNNNNNERKGDCLFVGVDEWGANTQAWFLENMKRMNLPEGQIQAHSLQVDRRSSLCADSFPFLFFLRLTVLLHHQFHPPSLLLLLLPLLLLLLCSLFPENLFP
jgi:hypothetical protein